MPQTTLKSMLFLPLLLISCTEPNQQSKASPISSSVKSTPIKSKTIDSIPGAQTTTIAFPKEIRYPWTEKPNQDDNIQTRIKPPKGYQRVPTKNGSFQEWLRFLPLHTADRSVHLYNGTLKGNQSAHHAVVDMDVGKRDLQQCADAVMRLKAEYHYSKKEYGEIHFNYTSGDEVSFEDWRKGKRPKVKGNKVLWTENGKVSNDYKNFRSYLQQIFNYAGTASLELEMKPKSFSKIKAGDVVIQGGHPGHAVLVLDVAENAEGHRVFLIGQSYMPAQEFHVLKNPTDTGLSPWFDSNVETVLETPEWRFNAEDLRGF